VDFKPDYVAGGNLNVVNIGRKSDLVGSGN